MSCSTISKYRTVLMGIATLWIAFLHAQMWFRNPILATFKFTGHNGVDVFLFLSGFGLYYAYQKTQGIEFLKRRFLRIIPVFIPVAIARIIYYHYNAQNAFYLLTTLAFWITHDRSMWYISMIVVLYLFTPFYLKYCFKDREIKCTILAIIIAFVVSFFFLDKSQLLFFGRVPIFLLGIYFGYLSHKDFYMNKKQMIILFGVMIVAFITELYLHSIDVDDAILFGKGGYWYCGFFFVPGLCYLISLCSKWFEQNHLGFINLFFEKLGSVSLSFYLLHEICIRFFSNIIHINPPYNYNGIFLNVLIIIFTYVLAYILQTCMSWIIERVGLEKRT